MINVIVLYTHSDVAAPIKRNVALTWNEIKISVILALDDYVYLPKEEKKQQKIPKRDCT